MPARPAATNARLVCPDARVVAYYFSLHWLAVFTPAGAELKLGAAAAASEDSFDRFLSQIMPRRWAYYLTRWKQIVIQLCPPPACAHAVLRVGDDHRRPCVGRRGKPIRLVVALHHDAGRCHQLVFPFVRYLGPP